MAVAVVLFVAFVVSFRLPLGDRADVWVGDPLGRELLRGPTRFIARMLATLRAAQSDVTGEDMILPDVLSRMHVSSRMRARGNKLIVKLGLTEVPVSKHKFAYKSFL